MSGIYKIKNVSTIISIAGQKQSCYFCLEQGHSLKDCPVKNLSCNKCKHKGHHESKCSLLERLKANEREKINYDDLILEDDDEIKTTEKNILTPAISSQQQDPSVVNHAIDNFLTAFSNQLTNSTSSQQTDQHLNNTNDKNKPDKAQKIKKKFTTSTPSENKTFKNIPSVSKPAVILITDINGTKQIKRTLASPGETNSGGRTKSLKDDEEVFDL